MSETLKADSKDFADMKLYIEGGAADGLKPLEFMSKYPQFDKYDKQSLRQNISRLRKAYKKKVQERGTRTCKFFILSLRNHHYFILLCVQNLKSKYNLQ